MFQKLAKSLIPRPGAVLTKDAIEDHLCRRRLVIEPLLHKVGSCSVDVRLDNYFGTFRSTGEAALDPGRALRAIEFEELPFFSMPFYVQPGTFVLAQTLEFIALPTNLVATLDGRSSIGRRGLVVHATAGWVDPGFDGHLTLELANLGDATSAVPYHANRTSGIPRATRLRSIPGAVSAPTSHSRARY